jgi:flagellar basal-body rod protein FlgC
MFGSLDISTSALVAQRTRLNVISANMANANSIDEQGNAFRRRITVFAPGDPSTGKSDGVHVKQIMLDDAPFRKVWDPAHEFADASGYVEYPNISVVTEQINAMEASRAYEANLTAAEATKSMIQASLRLIA